MEGKVFIENSDLDYFRSYLARVEEDVEGEEEEDYRPQPTNKKENPVSDNVLDSIREDLSKMMQSIQFSTDEERLLEPEPMDSNSCEIRSVSTATRSSHLFKNVTSPFSMEARKCRDDTPDSRRDKIFTLASCRKVSVVVQVFTQEGRDARRWEDNDDICVYPNLSSSDGTGDGKEEEEDTGDVVYESDQIILVNPKSFGKLLPTTVTVEVSLNHICISQIDEWSNL
jgi:hypothetical protein